MRPIRAAAILGVLLLAGLTTAACNTPTLPIPPPIVEQPLTLDPDGMVTVRVRSNIPDNASYLLVINQTAGRGVVEARLPDLTFEARIAAASGDVIVAWFLIDGGTGLSQSTGQMTVR